MEEKNLAEQLREIVKRAKAKNNYPTCTSYCKDVFGVSGDYGEGECEIFNAIADRIEREYMPRPLFEDGEPVQFGDEVELHYKSGGFEKGIVQEVHVNKGPVYILSFVGCDHERLFRYDSTCDVLKRPEPEVLDADGVPYSIGDTVWHVDDGTEGKVTGIRNGNPVIDGGLDFTLDWTHKKPVFDADGVKIAEGDTVYLSPEFREYAGKSTLASEYECGLFGVEYGEKLTVFCVDGEKVKFDGTAHAWCPASWLTHKQPDTFERIAEDLAKFAAFVVENIPYHDDVRNEIIDGVHEFVSRTKAVCERERGKA